MILKLYEVENPYLDWTTTDSNVLVVARNPKQAKLLGYKCIQYGRYTDILVRKIWNEVKTYTQPCVLDWNSKKDLELYRATDHYFEGDSACESCCFYTMNGAFPLCDECQFCEKCGHSEDCKEGV